MGDNNLIKVNKFWRLASILFGLILGFFFLAAFFNRAVPYSDPWRLESSLVEFSDEKVLVVLVELGGKEYAVETASVETEGDKLSVTFKGRRAFMPRTPFGRNQTTFSDNDWKQVFGFEISDDVNIVIESSTNRVLWKRDEFTLPMR